MQPQDQDSNQPVNKDMQSMQPAYNQQPGMSASGELIEVTSAPEAQPQINEQPYADVQPIITDNSFVPADSQPVEAPQPISNQQYFTPAPVMSNEPVVSQQASADTPVGAPKLNKKSSKKLIVIILALLLLFGGSALIYGFWYSNNKKVVEVQDATPVAIPNPVIDSTPLSTPAPVTPDLVVTPEPTTTPDPVVIPDSTPIPDPVVTPDPTPTPATDCTSLLLDPSTSWTQYSAAGCGESPDIYSESPYCDYIAEEVSLGNRPASDYTRYCGGA